MNDDHPGMTREDYMRECGLTTEQYKSRFGYLKRTQGWRARPLVERPANGWPVRVVKRCRCPESLLAFGFEHMTGRDAAQCLAEGWPESRASYCSDLYGSSYIEGEGLYGFMHDATGVKCVRLFDTLAEAQERQDEYFEAIGQFQPDALHVVWDLTQIVVTVD